MARVISVTLPLWPIDRLRRSAPEGIPASDERPLVLAGRVGNRRLVTAACAVAQELGFDPAKVNPNGSGISLGHPVGATGAIITTKAIAELHRTGGRYALVTMCIGGGQGIAAIFERV